MPPLSKNFTQERCAYRNPVAQHITEQEQQPSKQFYERVFNRNRCFAISTPTLDRKPTDNWKVLPKEAEFVVATCAATRWC